MFISIFNVKLNFPLVRIGRLYISTIECAVPIEVNWLDRPSFENIGIFDRISY